MLSFKRRTFVQLSSGTALCAASSRVFALGNAPSISGRPRTVRVTGSNYFLECSHHAAIADGELKIDAVERNATGKPLEWIEVRISLSAPVPLAILIGGLKEKGTSHESHSIF